MGVQTMKKTFLASALITAIGSSGMAWGQPALALVTRFN
jgi:hypothetical protein